MHAETLSCRRKQDVESISEYDFFDADNFTVINDTQYNHTDYLAEVELLACEKKIIWWRLLYNF